MASDADLENLALPISDDTNKELEQEVFQKRKEIEKLANEINEHKDRLQIMGSHLVNVRQELQLTQALYEARKSDVSTEKHLAQIAEREEARLKEDILHLKSEQREIKERMNLHENDLFRLTKKSEDMRSRMNWDQQALEAWLEESARKDEDALTIAKYARADEGKVKEMNLKLEQLNETVTQKKKMLNSETVATLTAQIEVDRTADAFRGAHAERQDLINQWEQIIEQMKRRDQDMDRTASELARLKAEIKVMNEMIREKQDFLEREKHNNNELDKEIELTERLSVKTRNEYQEKEKSLTMLRDELETLKYSVDRMATDLESGRSQNKNLKHDIKDKQKRLDTLKHQRQIMQQELKQSMIKTLTAEEKAHKMDQLLAEEEAKVAVMEKEIAALRDKQFKKAQIFHDLKKSRHSLDSEIQGSRVALRNLMSKQHKVDEEALKQQELLYTQDFQLQQLEHKLNRLEGERSEEEKHHLNNRIKELNTQWEEQSQSEQLLRSQLKTLQDDLRRVTREVDRGKKEKETMMLKIDEINLHIDNTERELRKIRAQKQDVMVDENIIKLQVKRLRDSLFSHADEVLSLEKQKIQLETLMKERSKEINVHKDMITSQIKANEADRQTVSSELHNRISKIDRLRKRYEMIMVAMAPPEGEEEHSQTYYVIKAAQEREEIQRQGDDLDAKIRKAEKEINALENTLKIINMKNEGFRKSLQRYDPHSDEAVELDNLTGQWRAVMDKYHHKRKKLRQLETEVLSLNNTLTSLNSEEQGCNLTLDERKDQLAALHKDLEEIRTKIQRADRQEAKLIKDLREEGSLIEYEDDIELRELRDFNQAILKRISVLANQDQQLAMTIQLLFSQVGLAPPQTPSDSRSGSLPTTARSSTSQLSTSLRSSISSRQSGTPIQTKTLDFTTVGVTESPRDGDTPRSDSTPQSSTSSLGRRGKKVRTPSGSKTPSVTSSRGSSRQASSPLDLTIRPIS